MLKNILFDMGEVLIRFDREYFINRLGVSVEDKKLLMKEVFLSVEWARLDWGTMTDEEAAESICARVPERLHEPVWKLVTMWDRPILPVDGMEDLVRELAENGYRLFLLSNAGSRQHEYWPRIPGSAFFTDTLISADVKLIKPLPEIYELACRKFGIVPEESLFIDDSAPNIEGARQAGMQGIVFHGDAGELRVELKRAGVNIR